MDEASIRAATIALKGDEWGDPPLWTVIETVPEGEEPTWSIDVHAVDADEARAKAIEWLNDAQIQDLRPDAVAVSALNADVDSLVAGLEKLPPDQPVTAVELLEILRPGVA